MPVSTISKNLPSRRRSALLLTVASSALLALPSAAYAQNRAPAVFSNVDENGVDLVLGTFEQAFTSLSIGSGDGALSFGFSTAKGVWGANTFTGGVEIVGNMATVYIGGDMERFTISGATYTSQQSEGSTLTLANGLYTYMRDDGTIIMFDQSKWPVAGTANALPTSIKTPDGSTTNIYYKTVGTTARIQSVTNNRGYQLKYNYQSATSPMLSSVTAINNGVDYCDPNADACAGFTQSWPTMSASTTSGAMTGANVYTITDAASRTSRFTVDAATRLTGIKRPGSATDNVSVTYSASGTVASVTANGVTHNYSYVVDSNNNDVTIMTRTNPFGKTLTVYFNLEFGRPTSVTNELGFTTNYLYDPSGRLLEITYPEANRLRYAYDARGNVTTTTSAAKDASAPDIVTTASYPATCTNPRTCNSPVTTSDAKGNITEYSYDPTTGVTTSVTAPAAVAGGVRAQTRLSYTNVQAYYKNSSGAIVASGQPIMVPTGSSTCQTLTSCIGTADEVKTVISYGPQSAGVANNLLPVAASTGSGDGALTAAVSTTYDIIGNQINVDGPLAGSADTVTTRYNAVRQVLGTISTDPDGSGPRKRAAQRLTYNADGQVTMAEVGTVNGTSEADWSAFASAQQAWTYYDANARLSRESVSASGVNYSVVDYSYDALGRNDCVAQRLNPAVWGTQISACSAQAVGTSGPDRISRTVYDDAGQVTQVQSALGTSAAQTVTQTYNPNGTQATLIDGKGNKTTFIYDGFDRPMETHYPLPNAPGQSSNTDYEGVQRDTNGNVTLRRVRDGHLISYAYDNLNRLVSKSLPASWPRAIYEWDTSYQYDLLGRLTRAQDTNTHYAALTYDALGRQVSEASNFSTRTFAYDVAGRRTALNYGDGFSVTYDYDTIGAVTAIRENGGAVLASYAYDDLGRRTSLTRGNGTATNYSYDPASRLASFAHDFTGTLQDVTSSFTYNTASQIASRTRSNDLFAWNGATALTRAYTNNGLNQHTASGSTALGYDGRGNLTASGSNSYAYTLDNRLASVTGLNFGYDPLGRMHYPAGVSGGPTLQYDGDALIREQDGAGATFRRYVHGPGVDEPILWYEGAGLTDKRYLHADERGSIIAISNTSGSVTQINAYDDYGIPQGKNAAGAVFAGGTNTANFGRFGYTGQTWLPEIGLNYYKNRVYSPTLGRFLQADPIGYADGVNLYGYVGGDPINATDPSGLATIVSTACGGLVPIRGRCPELGMQTSTSRFPPLFQNPSFDTFTRDIDLFEANEERQESTCKASGGSYTRGNLTISNGTCQEATRDGLLDKLKAAYCSLPSFGGGITAGGYAGVGGGVTGEFAFDPISGRIAISAGLNVGVGVGFSVAGTANTGRRVSRGPAFASVGANANVAAGPLRLGAAATIIDRSGINPRFNGLNGGARTGTGLTANANLTARVGTGLQILPRCKK